MRSELFRKGVDGDLAEEAIDEAFAESGLDEIDLARRLAGKRVKTLVSLETEAARRRLTGYLARRGFPPPVVRAVVTEALPSESAGPSDAPAPFAD